MKPDLKFLSACAAFCRAHGAPHYYADWGTLTLLEYLNFHAQQDTLQVVMADRRWEMADGEAAPTPNSQLPSPICQLPSANSHLPTPILGLGVCWQDRSARVRETMASGTMDFFAWEPTHPHGDCLVLAHFIATAPGALARLVRQAMARFPHWRDLKFYTQRRRPGGGHRFREYSVRTIGRMADLKLAAGDLRFET